VESLLKNKTTKTEIEWSFAFLGVIADLIFTALLAACPSPADPASATPSNGTLTFTITGETAYNGKLIAGFVVPHGTAPLLASPYNFVAYHGLDGVTPSIITSGTASMTFKAMPIVSNAASWTGTGGSSYDVYVLIDMTNNGPSTDDHVSTPWPIVVAIDGNTTISKTAADYTATFTSY
jgi:hypothetical protein